MPIGTVKFFNDSKGYGFIQQDGGGSDVFVHVSAVERAGLRSLRENQRLSFDLDQDNRGKTMAVNLQMVEAEQGAQPHPSQSEKLRRIAESQGRSGSVG